MQLQNGRILFDHGYQDILKFHGNRTSVLHMSTHPSPEISGTAFVVNYSRSRCVDISSDIYASLWVTQEAIDLWNTFSQEVYPYDDLNISLRNRFYLSHLEKFSREFPNGVCLNLGAGFTNYPFLLRPGLRFFDFDLPFVCSYKKQAVSGWISEGKLPDRDVHYISTDLNNRQELSHIKDLLMREANGTPSLVMLEGVTYYLELSILHEIFELLYAVQSKGSLIVFDYWRPDVMEYPVMIRLKKFMEQHFGFQGQQYTLFDQTFIHQIQGYEEIESTSITDLEQQYTTTRIFQERDLRIPVYYSVIERT